MWYYRQQTYDTTAEAGRTAHGARYYRSQDFQLKPKRRLSENYVPPTKKWYNRRAVLLPWKRGTTAWHGTKLATWMAQMNWAFGRSDRHTVVPLKSAGTTAAWSYYSVQASITDVPGKTQIAIASTQFAKHICQIDVWCNQGMKARFSTSYKTHLPTFRIKATTKRYMNLRHLQNTFAN